MNLVNLFKKVKFLLLTLAIALVGFISINLGAIATSANSDKASSEEKNLFLSLRLQKEIITDKLFKLGASLQSSFNPKIVQNDSSVETATTNATVASIVQYPIEINADSPIAFYRFSETNGNQIADLSGNGRTITLSGSYLHNASELLLNQAEPDKALTIDDANGITNDITTTNGISLSMMIKFSSVANNPTIFESGQFSSVTSGYHSFTYNSGNQELRWYYNKSDGSGFYNASINFIPTLGRIYHLAITHNYTTKTINFYIDGYLAGSTVTATGALPLTNQQATFFSNLKGTTDDLAIFNMSLPESRVKAQFAASRGADATQNVYYSSPNASIYGRGTQTDPIDLQAAFVSAFVEGGKTLELLEGNYVETLNILRSGSPDSRIKIRGQLGRRVTIDGAGLTGDVIRLSGSYIDISRLEIKKTWIIRTSNIVNTQGCPILGTNGTLAGSGISDTGDHNRVYYNIIHDVLGEGIGSGSSATNSEYYGNLVFNNGWFAPRILGGEPAANGHGIYTQNNAPSVKRISKNIFINPYSSPIKAAGSGVAEIENFIIAGNLSVNGGFAYDVGGSNHGVDNVAISEERVFNNDMKLGYNSNAGRTISLIDSYVYGGGFPLQITDFNSVVVTGNTVVGSGGDASATVGIKVKTAFFNSTVNNNTYFHNRAQTSTVFLVSNPQYPTYQGYNFANWRTISGWDSNSVYVSNGTQLTQPVDNKIIIEPLNAYEANHGYVAVYNWENASTQSVNLSSILAVGTRYEIRSASNYYAGVILTGTYNGGSVTLPLTLPAGLPGQALPYGDIARNAEPAPKFAAFIIAPLPQLVPTPTPTPTPVPTPSVTPTPAPTPTPEEVPTPTPSLTPTPTPTPTPEMPTPTPTPTSTPTPEIPTPTPTLTPTLTPTPEAPTPTPTPEVPTPTPTPEIPTPTPTPEVPTPTPTPSLTPTPTLTPTPLDHSTLFDFDGDHKADISLFRPSDNTWYLRLSQMGFSALQFGISSDKSVAADYDGDGKTDIAVWRAGSFAYFYILQSSTNTVRSEQFGQTGDSPMVVGDWDGDEKADLAVYRNGLSAGEPSSFFYRPSAQPNTNFVTVYWGAQGDVPQCGDFDGDGKLDAAVFRPSTNIWYIRQSSNGQMVSDQWGLLTDEFVSGDYDGDGKTDLAVFRSGIWYLKQSTDGFKGIQFGQAGDKPVAADYDGDGKTDLGVFRNGIWYLLRSRDGFAAEAFGLPTDKAIANAFVP